MLRFTYPDEPEGRRQRRDATATPTDRSGRRPTNRPRSADRSRDAQLRLEQQGRQKLLPARIYDDGIATFLTWPAGSPVPAILIRNDKGAEGPVNFAVRGDVIVVDGVPREIVLRSGKDGASLVNSGPLARAPAACAAASARTQRRARPADGG